MHGQGILSSWMTGPVTRTKKRQEGEESDRGVRRTLDDVERCQPTLQVLGKVGIERAARTECGLWIPPDTFVWTPTSLGHPSLCRSMANATANC